MSYFSLPWTIVSLYLVIELFTRGAIIRWIVREILRFFVLLELAAIWLVQFVYRPKFVLHGACHKCGACCRQIIADPPKFVKNTPLLSLFAGYHRLFHNFHVAGTGPNDEIILTCGHLRHDGRCGVYRFRPLLCRNYPVLPFFDPPLPLPNCGFSVAPRVVVKMKNRESLPIVNPFVAVHHPTPQDRDEPVAEHFRLVDES